MQKTFYENSSNISRKKIKELNSFSLNQYKSNSFNNKNEKYFEESGINNYNNSNLKNNINNFEQTKNDIKGNNKKEFGYIFYGKNKLFKTINKNFSSFIVSAKNKNLYNNLGDKNINKKEIIQSNNAKNNKGIKIKRQFSNDIILNDIYKNYRFSEKIKNKIFKDKNILIKNPIEYFPNIYRLNNIKYKNELNFNINNDKNIQIEQLNQLHKNFINSIKNPSKLFPEKEIKKNFSSDFKNEKIKNKNNNFETSNNSQKWFDINNKNINEYINKNKNEDIKLKPRNYIKINSNNRFSKINLNKKNISPGVLNNFIKNNNESLLKNTNLNNTNISNNSNMKRSNSIKINIKKHLKDKENIFDKKESKSNSSFSINFSYDTENNNKNFQNENEYKKNNNELNNDIKTKINNSQSSYSQIKEKYFQINSKFVFTSKDKNFSFHSIKNMKIEENNNRPNICNNKTKENEMNNNEKKEKEKEKNSNVKYNFKTSSYFYSHKFNNNKNEKENTTNIENIINNVIENNRRAGQARVSNSFYNLGKNYLNNKIKNTQKNFYKNKNYYYSGDTNFEKDQNKDEISRNLKNRKLNFIQLTIISPSLWKKHEEVWENISNKNYNDKYENYILPPNDTDILISSYIRIYPTKLNTCVYSRVNSISKEEKEILNFCIDDDIQNPKNEIKKWKNVYKKMIFRWHPDKLFPLLKELNIKNEYIKKELERRSSLIINNINTLYQNIMEILKKIILYKEKDNKIKEPTIIKNN